MSPLTPVSVFVPPSNTLRRWFSNEPRKHSVLPEPVPLEMIIDEG